MDHTKMPKKPELNAHTAPMWALWHYHSRDMHHGMHPGHTPTASVATEDLDRQDHVQHASPQSAEPVVHTNPTRAKDPRPVHSIQHASPDGKGSVQLAPTPVKPVSSGPALSAGSKESALAQLAEKIRQFKEPSIAQTAKNMVFADGNPNSAIMWIGEAPGAEEDAKGKPFVGASGKLLDAMMASIQLDRTRCYITNVVPWRPPFNRQPSGAEIKMFLPFLQEHIRLISPRVLICVGGVAAKAVLNLDQTLTRAQGQLLWYTDPLLGTTIPAWTLYHPAYLMRAPGQKRAAWEQLLCIRAFLTEQSIAPRMDLQNGYGIDGGAE
jgi:uracil-DNA glycosylase family 4